MRKHLPVFGPRAGELGDAGFGWRHLATLLLLLVTLPIFLAAGAASEGEMANRGAHGVAERLGTRPVVFPSHHGGFAGNEYGWPGEPDAFAAKLREVLDATT